MLGLSKFVALQVCDIYIHTYLEYEEFKRIYIYDIYATVQDMLDY